MNFICQPCKDGKPEECLGRTKDKTWCDREHKDAK